MKKKFVVLDIILFTILIIMICAGHFGADAWLVSLVYTFIAVLEINVEKGLYYQSLCVVKALISIFFFLANGPSTLDWFFSEGITFQEIAIFFMVQIIVVMFVVAKRWARLEKFVAKEK